MSLGWRIGQGYDAHRFGLKPPLVLGGVVIPEVPGLLAHSDGDVLVHALMDALLGALALGDIGLHFPDHHSRYRGMASTQLLAQVMRQVRAASYALGNVDCTIIAERPKISPYTPDIRASLSRHLAIPTTAISVKATTVEGMGALGRCEGIASTAVVLLYRQFV